MRLLPFHRTATHHARLAPLMEQRGGLLMRAGTVTTVGFACATRPRRLVKGERAERSRGPRSSLQSEPVSRRGLAECLLGNGTRNHVLCKLTPSRRRVLRSTGVRAVLELPLPSLDPKPDSSPGTRVLQPSPRCSSRWRAFLSPAHNFTDPRCCRKATAPSRVRGRVSCNSRD